MEQVICELVCVSTLHDLPPQTVTEAPEVPKPLPVSVSVPNLANAVFEMDDSVEVRDDFSSKLQVVTLAGGTW